uniref:Uncharacterized protein n=1 Tax=Trypanosoma congolense (strain IL3000) TaxID=1068625 RepID=G0UWP5_TRYCI|nr:conserved hypothetical protein [Trypanosoma congolense IL3000]
MEVVVYRYDFPTPVRLQQLKTALLAFTAVPELAPPAVALFVPLTLGVCASSRGVQHDGGSKADAAAAAARLQLACKDRGTLRRWLRTGVKSAMSILVAASFESLDDSQLLFLTNWQRDVRRSPLRNADIVSFSLRDVETLLGRDTIGPSNTRRSRSTRVPPFSQLLLPHQVLLLDMTHWVSSGNRGKHGLSLFSQVVRRQHVAKGRTAVVTFYSSWLPLTATKSGLHNLQMSFQELYKYVLSYMELPMCCSYGRSVEELQRNVSTLSCATVSQCNDSEPATAYASLLFTRSLRDVYCLLGFLLGQPQVNHYAEAKSFCMRLQARMSTSRLVRSTCVECLTPLVSNETLKSVTRKRKRSAACVTDLVPRGEERNSIVKNVSLQSDEASTLQNDLWYEDKGQ